MAASKGCRAAALAALVVALALAAPAPAAASGIGRALKQFYDRGYFDRLVSGGGYGYPGYGYGYGYPGYGYGWGRYSEPVGSGCYDPQTLQRISTGGTVYCPGGGRMQCNWGQWVNRVGTCAQPGYGKSPPPTQQQPPVERAPQQPSQGEQQQQQPQQPSQGEQQQQQGGASIITPPFFSIRF